MITGIPTQTRYYVTNSGDVIDMKLARFECQGDVWSNFLAFHDLWKKIILSYQLKVQKSKKFLGQYLWRRDELHSVCFWI